MEPIAKFIMSPSPFELEVSITSTRAPASSGGILKIAECDETGNN